MSSSSLRGCITSDLAPGVLGGFGGDITGGDGAAEAAQNEEDDKQNGSENDNLSEGGVTNTVVGPCAAASTSIFLERVGTELVVDQTTKSDRVAEELEGGHRVTEDEHRGNDEKDILQHAGKSEDEGGSLANLCRVESAPAG